MSVKVQLEVDLPDKLLPTFLQYIRDFEQRMPDRVHVAMWAEAASITVEEMQAIFAGIKPPFPYQNIAKFGIS